MSIASLGDRLMHAKRETKSLKAQLQASRTAYDELLAAFDKSVYTPQAMARRNMFKRARDKYNG
jgi:hypothetical protein